MAHRTDEDLIQNERNTARFFVENRQISWILLIATVVLGIYGYTQMPKRKDPDIPVRVASVITQYPGATAEQVEQLVTRPIESTIAQNPNIRAPRGGDFGIKSLSMPGISIVQVQLSDTVKDSKKEFSDMNLKLNSLSLPTGRRADQVQQRFRGHRGADVDRGQPAGRCVDYCGARARGGNCADQGARAAPAERRQSGFGRVLLSGFGAGRSGGTKHPRIRAIRRGEGGFQQNRNSARSGIRGDRWTDECDGCGDLRDGPNICGNETARIRNAPGFVAAGGGSRSGAGGRDPGRRAGE